MTWILRGLGLLIGLVLTAACIVAGGALVYRHLALPVTKGQLAVTGLRAGLEIERDEHGIPTIRAASDDDAWFGLGFVHAQDRLWQLETHRRIGAGRLAEVFGASAVDSDRFLCVLGVRRRAEQQWEQASPAVRQLHHVHRAQLSGRPRRVISGKNLIFLTINTLADGLQDVFGLRQLPDRRTGGQLHLKHPVRGKLK